MGTLIRVIEHLFGLDVCLNTSMSSEVAGRNACVFQDFFKHRHIICSIVGVVCLATEMPCQRFLCIRFKARMFLFYYIDRIAQCRPYRVKSIFHITGTQSPVHHYKIKIEPILSYIYDIIKFLQPVQEVIERGLYSDKINGVALVGKNPIAPIYPRDRFSII